MDEGAPSSYLLLAKDTPVFGSDGGVAGKVKEVLAVSSLRASESMASPHSKISAPCSTCLATRSRTCPPRRLPAPLKETDGAFAGAARRELRSTTHGPSSTAAGANALRRGRARTAHADS